MLDYHDHGCGRIGRWIGVLCAALGVATAYLMIQLMNLGWYIPVSHLPKEITFGLVVLFLTSAFLGERGGMRLCGKSDDVSLNVLVGQGVAFGSITIAVMSATLIGIVSAAGTLVGGPGFTPLGLVFALFIPLLLVLLVGALPAVGLGVLYGLLVRNRLRKLNQ